MDAIHIRGWSVSKDKLLKAVLRFRLLFAMANLLSSKKFVVRGGSMTPILSDGEYLMISRLAYLLASPDRGDIVVFHHPVYADKDYVKRIVGLPGEHLRIEDGRVFIDGALLEEHYLRGDSHSADSYNMEWFMEEGQYFVMGDNRRDSQDSRSFWSIQRERIVGKAWLRYWPLSRWGAIKVVMPHETNPD